MSLFIELQKGPPVILCGDAADLRENLVEEITPGYAGRITLPWRWPASAS
jgi:hypothetical protein